MRRHFPTCRALLEAVFKQRVHDLCERVHALRDEPDSRAALVEWLRELLASSLAARGLADVLSHQPLQWRTGVQSRRPGPRAPMCRRKVSFGVNRLVVRASWSQVRSVSATWSGESSGTVRVGVASKAGIRRVCGSSGGVVSGVVGTGR